MISCIFLYWTCITAESGVLLQSRCREMVESVKFRLVQALQLSYPYKG